jgi:hypothetical protein
MNNKITVEGVEIDPYQTEEGWEVCEVCEKALWSRNMAWGACIRDENWWKEHYPHESISPMMVCKKCFDSIDNGDKNECR